MEFGQRPPLPIFLYLILPGVVLCFLIAFHPAKKWRLLALGSLAYMNTRALSYTAGNEVQDYGIGSIFTAQTFIVIHLLLLTNPLLEFRHDLDTVPPSTLSIHKRLWWSLSVIHGHRGIRWNYQVPHVLPVSTLSRWQFVQDNALRALRCFLIVDIFQSYLYLNPIFAISGTNALPITAQGFVLRCLNIIALVGTPTCMLNLQYTLLATVAVAFNFSEPNSWPSLFGRWADAYTLRRFWGRTWHQLLRRFFASSGKYTAQTLGFMPGSRGSSYTQLYVAFFISGLLHIGGDAMVDPWLIGVSFPFFFMQPFAIMLEDMIIAYVGRMKLIPSSISRIVGYVWVFLWFAITLPLALNWWIKAGIVHSEALPISPLRFFLRILHIDVNQYLI